MEILLDVWKRCTYGLFGFFERAVSVLSTLAWQIIPLIACAEKIKPLVLQLLHHVVLNWVIGEHGKTCIAQRLSKTLGCIG